MARRHVFILAIAGFAAPLAVAAPASELSGVIAPIAAQSPVTLLDFLQRARQPVAAAQATGQVARGANDGTAYRFDMTQNGRRMTAAEFDAWMKARGIRVATGKPAGSQPAAAAPAASTATTAANAVPACQPSRTTKC